MIHKEVIIIGAPRSGTNMLRDILTSLDGIASWPCDEINYIWRHGNVQFPSDEIPVEKATSSVKGYIQQQFFQIHQKYNVKYVLEKTCANSLRVPFVDTIFPNAKYIFIYRDGIDATGSAKERWTAGLDIPYLLDKIKFVPKIDLPYYAVRYLWAQIYRLFSKEKRLAFWGPALDDMRSLMCEHTLNEVCALQWQRCVDKSEQAFALMPVDKVIRVRYEDFVREPRTELSRIVKFIGLDVQLDEIARAVAGVSSHSVGKGRKTLGKEEVENLEALVGNTLKRYDYL